MPPHVLPPGMPPHPGMPTQGWHDHPPPPQFNNNYTRPQNFRGSHYTFTYLDKLFCWAICQINLFLFSLIFSFQPWKYGRQRFTIFSKKTILGILPGFIITGLSPYFAIAATVFRQEYSIKTTFYMN